MDGRFCLKPWVDKQRAGRTDESVRWSLKPATGPGPEPASASADTIRSAVVL